MTASEKTKIFLIFCGILILFSVVFVVRPLISQIGAESENFFFQEKRLETLRVKTSYLDEFEEKYQVYHADLQKIDGLLIDPTEPIDFIEFLEEQTQTFSLSLEITPSPRREIKEDLWPSMNFQLSLSGAFSDFAKFLEKLESGPYLVEILSLNVREDVQEENDNVVVNLSIKVYSQ